MHYGCGACGIGCGLNCPSLLQLLLGTSEGSACAGHTLRLPSLLHTMQLGVTLRQVLFVAVMQAFFLFGIEEIGVQIEEPFGILALEV